MIDIEVSTDPIIKYRSYKLHYINYVKVEDLLARLTKYHELKSGSKG